MTESPAAESTGQASDGAGFDELLAGVRSGDEAAATELYRRVHPRLLRYLRSQEPRVAEDLESDVWLAVTSSLGSFTGSEAGFRGWVFTIARRRVIDHRRKSIRRGTEPVGPHDLDHIVDPSASDEVTARNDSQEAVDLVASLLSSEQAEVVLLRVLGGLDADAVADIMGRSTGWVRVTQHRALRRLAARIPRMELTP